MILLNTMLITIISGCMIIYGKHWQIKSKRLPPGHFPMKDICERNLFYEKDEEIKDSNRNQCKSK